MKRAVKILKALSESTRLRIVILLLERDLCVCELLFILDMEQSRISHHLRILRDAELTEDIRNGKWIIYRIPGQIKKGLTLLLNQFFGEDLHQSEQVQRDKTRLQLCLKKQVRKSQEWLR